MSIEVLWYFCQSFLDVYKEYSLNTHMYRDWAYFLIEFLSVYSPSLSLCLSRIYYVSLSSPLNLRFSFSTRFLYLLPHVTFYNLAIRTHTLPHSSSSMSSRLCSKASSGSPPVCCSVPVSLPASGWIGCRFGVVKIRHYVRIVRRNHQGSRLEGFSVHSCNTSKIYTLDI